MSASRTFYPTAGTLQKGLVQLFGFHTTTTSGTLSTTTTAFSPAKECGYTLTKTGSETGRYTVQLTKTDGTAATYNQLLYVHATLVGADDTAYTTDAGLIAFVRDNDVATDGTFEVQFATGDANADAEVIDGAVILLQIVLKNSTV